MSKFEKFIRSMENDDKANTIIDGIIAEWAPKGNGYEPDQEIADGEKVVGDFPESLKSTYRAFHALSNELEAIKEKCSEAKKAGKKKPCEECRLIMAKIAAVKVRVKDTLIAIDGLKGLGCLGLRKGWKLVKIAEKTSPSAVIIVIT